MDGNVSTELQSLTGFNVITIYPVPLDILTELQSLTGFRSIIRHLGQFVVLNSYMITALSGKNEESSRVF
jgi:hypothetical protein